MRVLIVGAGIAGLTLSWWLRRAGHEVVLIERAPRVRDEGYMIDFFGSGYDVAERMNLLDALAMIHYPVGRLSLLAPSGREKLALPYPTLRKRLFADRHFNFMRGDLERLLHARVANDVAIRFRTTVDALAQEGSVVRAALSDGSLETFDLVVGADGVHSRVRELAFGAEAGFSRYLGFHTAAFVVDDEQLCRETGDAFQTMTTPGRQVAIYPIRGDRVATFFIHRADEPRVDLAAAKAELNAVYGDLRWVVPRLLEHLERVHAPYFDTVTQIELPRWTNGRITLVGDACQCVSLLAGQGASLAMGGAYVLAEELAAGDVDAALARYERRLRPAVERKQRAGRSIARWFVPGNQLMLALRDFTMRFTTWSLAAYLFRRKLATDSVLSRVA
jgi:2-polyprenyl-6-methoxyphenol hydroxylase-like FAD-dependent oxidoreductase